MGIAVISSAEFENEVLKCDIPVLVDFFAEWCMPCKMLAPVLEQLAEEYDGKLKIFKVDIDQAMDVANQYSIRSVPTLIFFKNGDIVEHVLGAVPKQTLAEKIKKVTLNN